ncbi:hypothetical protein GCM10009789_09020 [Kribbella sancticallisti]|uniref:Uncharacterized protein n=1 Tax=Kribbella sancticallisti TaxID=460087 RepID=A0ABP4N8H9_9ACTN
MAHVVMMVANSIDNDSRVLKEAVAIARTGVRVTLLGVAPTGGLSVDCLDASAVLARLPAAFPLRDERRRRLGRRRARRLPLLGYRITADRLARQAWIGARQADLKAESGWAVANRRSGALGSLRYRAGVADRRLRQELLRVAAKGVRVRVALTSRQNKWFTSAWGRWDRTLSRIERPARWRRVVPEAYDYERIFGQALDELAPDVLHAHDMHLVGVAVRAAGRAALRGRKIEVIYDAHEYVVGLSRYGGRTPRFISAWANHEAEYIGAADRVITVSPAIARTLRDRYRLDREPTVVINTPRRAEIAAGVVDVRTRLELPSDVPLLVYSGGITKARGVETAIQALPSLPGVHLAVVCVPSTETGPVRELRKLAESLRVGDRMHYLDPVEPDEVVSFLRTADIGLIPILRYPSHDMALPNKVFEYVFAGLPVVTSDMTSLTEFVRRTGIGEAFEAENPADLAAKVTRVLADPTPYREQASRPDFQEEVSWEGQAAKLRELYGELLGQELAVAERQPTEPRLLITPIDGSGQASQWAQAVERLQPRIGAEAMPDHSSGTGRLLGHADYLLNNVSHVLFQAGQTPDGWFPLDPRFLDAAGIAHAVVLHEPEVHGTGWAGLKDRLADYKGLRFVTSPELLDYVDDSLWLPLVVELGHEANPPVLERAVPRVLAVKGSGADAALGGLAERGLIEYELINPAPSADLRSKMRAADLVIERPGSYGVVAVTAMAAGRLTIGHVPSNVRERLPLDLPIVEATPETVGELIEKLLIERDEPRQQAARGPAYVHQVHDGGQSVQALLPFLQQ